MGDQKMPTSIDETKLQKVQRLKQVCENLSQQAEQMLNTIADLGDELNPLLTDSDFLPVCTYTTDDASKLCNNLKLLTDILDKTLGQLAKQQAESEAAKKTNDRRWKAIFGEPSDFELSPEAVELLSAQIALEFNVLPVATTTTLIGRELYVRSDFLYRNDDSEYRLAQEAEKLGYKFIRHIFIRPDQRDELTRLVQKYYAPKRRFGEIAIELGIITMLQLDEALGKQNKNMGHHQIGEILVRLGYISKPHIVQILAEQLHLKLVTAKELYDISSETVKLIDGGVATLYRVIPLGFKVNERGRQILEIATASPNNTENRQNLERLLDRPICYAVASPEAISGALSRLYGLEPNTPPLPFHLLRDSGPTIHTDPPPELAVGGDISIENDPVSVCGSPNQLDDPNWPPQDGPEIGLPELPPDGDDDIFDL
jgi:hypothetical protein